MRFLVVLLILTICACKAQTLSNKKLVNALTNPKIKVKGTLIEINSQQFRLDYYDGDEKDSQIKFLNKNGYQGGGPSWRGIIYGAIKMSDPSIQDKVRFDDEADGLAIWSSKKEALSKIGRLISIVKSDQKVLLEAIAVAEKDGEME